ncbi:MAG: hypothetical protein WCY77_02155 [Weeksellaceae bacterium]
MKQKANIFSLFLSVMVFLSPLMAYAIAMHPDEVQIEMDCCVMDPLEMDDVHSCCMNDTDESSKKCDDSPCHTSPCHISHVNVLPAYFPEDKIESKAVFISSKKLKTDNYKSLLPSEVSSPSWKPPKHIS